MRHLLGTALAKNCRRFAEVSEDVDLGGPDRDSVASVKQEERAGNDG
jgi:hypothetical protein